MKTILVVNDIHVGSNVAIMPDRVNAYGNKIKSNDLQAHLYEEWLEMCDLEKYDICIVNGDTCDGVNSNEHGYGCWTTDDRVQVKVAADLLQRTGAESFYCTQGSLYHTGKPSMDRLVNDRLGGHFDEDMILTVEGVRFHVRHKTPYTSTPYGRSTALNKDMVNSVLGCQSYGDIDVFLRAHTHYHHYVGWDGRLGLVNGGWKSQDAHMRRNSIGNGDFGYTVFYVDKGQYTWETHSFKMPGGLMSNTIVH